MLIVTNRDQMVTVVQLRMMYRAILGNVATSNPFARFVTSLFETFLFLFAHFCTLLLATGTCVFILAGIVDTHFRI